MFQRWGSLGRWRTASGTAGSTGSASRARAPGSRHGVAAQELRRLPERRHDDDQRTGRQRPRIDAAADARRPPRAPARGRARRLDVVLGRDAHARRVLLGPELPTSAADGLVGDVEGAVDDVEALGQLLLGDAQRRVGVDRLLATNVYRPCSRRYLPTAFISSLVPLYGAIGSRSRGRGRAPGCRTGRCCGPRPRTGASPQALVVAAHHARRGGRRSMSPSSS